MRRGELENRNSLHVQKGSAPVTQDTKAKSGADWRPKRPKRVSLESRTAKWCGSTALKR